MRFFPKIDEAGQSALRAISQSTATLRSGHWPAPQNPRTCEYEIKFGRTLKPLFGDNPEGEWDSFALALGVVDFVGVKAQRIYRLQPVARGVSCTVEFKIAYPPPDFNRVQ